MIAISHLTALSRGSLALLFMLLSTVAFAEETTKEGDTTVYRAAGKKRVHVMACKRLTQDPEALANNYTKMTYAEAKEKGLPLCSRCPGTTTPRK